MHGAITIVFVENLEGHIQGQYMELPFNLRRRWVDEEFSYIYIMIFYLSC